MGINVRMGYTPQAFLQLGRYQQDAVLHAICKKHPEFAALIEETCKGDLRELSLRHADDVELYANPYHAPSSLAIHPNHPEHTKLHKSEAEFMDRQAERGNKIIERDEGGKFVERVARPYQGSNFVQMIGKAGKSDVYSWVGFKAPSGSTPGFP